MTQERDGTERAVTGQIGPEWAGVGSLMKNDKVRTCVLRDRYRLTVIGILKITFKSHLFFSARSVALFISFEIHRGSLTFHIPRLLPSRSTGDHQRIAFLDFLDFLDFFEVLLFGRSSATAFRGRQIAPRAKLAPNPARLFALVSLLSPSRSVNRCPAVPTNPTNPTCPLPPQTAITPKMVDTASYHKY